METKTVKLPSGLDVTFRRPSGLDQVVMLGALRRIQRMGASSTNQALVEAMAAEDTPQDAEDRLFAVARRACRVCVSPQFVLEAEPPFGKRSLHELAFADYVQLLNEIEQYANESEEQIRPLPETATAS